MRTRHTETPWTLEHWKYANDYRTTPTIVGREDAIAQVCGLYRPGGDDTEQKANAEYIVRAVNAHDSLVAALQSMVAVDDACQRGRPLLSSQGQGMDVHMKLANYDCCIRAAREAIAQATGQEAETT